LLVLYRKPLRVRELSLDDVFREAGVRIVRAGPPKTLASATAGPDHEWSQRELHDAMSANWEAFANRSQWKLWVLLANHADKSMLAGVMFDANIDEPGGVDRQAPLCSPAVGTSSTLPGTSP
jgi:hypothetical protein